MNIYDGTYSPSRIIIRRASPNRKTETANNMVNNKDVDNVINRNINDLYKKKIDGIKLDIEKVRSQIVEKNDELHRLSAEKNALKLNKAKLKRKYRSLQSEPNGFSEKINEMQASLFDESNNWKAQLMETAAETEKISDEINALRHSQMSADNMSYNMGTKGLSDEIDGLVNELKELQEWYNAESSIQFEETEELSLSNLKVNLENGMSGIDEKLTELESENQEKRQAINKFEILSEQEIFTEYNLLLEYQVLKKVKKVYILLQNENIVSNNLEYDSINGTQYKFGKIFTTFYECSIFLRVFLRKNLLNKKISICLSNFDDSFLKILYSTFSYIDSITENLRLDSKLVKEYSLEHVFEQLADFDASQDFQSVQLNGTIYQKPINLRCDISSNFLKSTSPSNEYDDTLIIVNTTERDSGLNAVFDFSNEWNKF